MRHLIWIVIGVLLGLFARPFLFRKQKTVGNNEPRAPGPSLIGRKNGNQAGALKIPKVMVLSSEEAASYWEHPPLSGTKEASSFYLGMLELTETASEMSAIANHINRSTDAGDLQDLVEAIFEKLASRDPVKAIAAAEMLENPSFQAVAMRSVIGEWASANPNEALAFLQGIPEETESDYRLFGEAARRMALKDPRAAMERLEKFPLTKRHHYDVVLSRWLDQDPKAGMEWLLVQDETKFREALTDQALRSLAAHDSEKAFELALTIPYKVRGRHPAQSMLQDLAALPLEGSLEKAIEGLQKLPGNLLTEDFMQRFASHAALNSPDKALEAITSEKFPLEANLRESFMEGVVVQIAHKDPAKAAGAADRLVSENSLTNVYEAIIRSWMKSDEFAAAEWLSGLDPSESRDKAIRTFTEELLPIDPERALQWAKSISDDRRREEQLRKLEERIEE